MPDPAFFDFVINLVKLGGLGVGALIFVMAFIILFRNQAASADMASFRTSFLRWGFTFAVVALVASTATDAVRSLAAPGRVRLGVTISPDFAEAKLPPPQLVLMPAGTPIQPNTSTEIDRDATLAIQVKGIVESVNGLAQSSETLLQTNQKLTDAIDKSSQIVSDAAAPGAASTAPAAMKEIPVLKPTELANMKAAQSNIASSLAAGKFSQAAKDTIALHQITTTAEGLRK